MITSICSAPDTDRYVVEVVTGETFIMTGSAQASIARNYESVLDDTEIDTAIWTGG